VDTYLRLALKAQSQCRTTLETLDLIRNPRSVAFVRQANIANGPQQVNNGTPPTATHARAREKLERTPNELLENDHGNRLEQGTTPAAGAGNPSVEAMAALERADDTGR
jgi:hypothetical protein